MMRIFKIIVLLVGLFAVHVCVADEPEQSDTQYRGFTVVSHEYPIAELEEIKASGANLVRWMLYHTWPWQDETDFAEYRAWLSIELDKLDEVMAEAERLGLKIAVDLHDVPGGRWPDQSNRLFYDQTFLDQYVEVWEEIAERYHGHPALYGYGMMNEPVEINGKKLTAVIDSIEAQLLAGKAIRIIDPDTSLIFASTAWNAPTPFFEKTVPLKNVIYEVHVYQPMQYTHQGITGFPFSEAYTYPGEMTSDGWYVDEDILREQLTTARKFQQDNPGVRIFVGEFSTVRWAGGASQWLQDNIELFEEYQWDWVYHAWTENQYFALDIENGTFNDGGAEMAPETTDRREVIFNALKRNQ